MGGSPADVIGLHPEPASSRLVRLLTPGHERVSVQRVCRDRQHLCLRLRVFLDMFWGDYISLLWTRLRDAALRGRLVLCSVWLGPGSGVDHAWVGSAQKPGHRVWV